MLRLREMVHLVDEKCTYVVVSDKKKLLCEMNLTEKETYRNYTVTWIGSENGSVVLKLRESSPPEADVNGEWAKEYEQQNGVEPSFF